MTNVLVCSYVLIGCVHNMYNVQVHTTNQHRYINRIYLFFPRLSTSASLPLLPATTATISSRCDHIFRYTSTRMHIAYTVYTSQHRTQNQQFTANRCKHFLRGNAKDGKVYAHCTLHTHTHVVATIMCTCDEETTYSIENKNTRIMRQSTAAFRAKVPSQKIFFVSLLLYLSSPIHLFTFFLLPFYWDY